MTACKCCSPGYDSSRVWRIVGTVSASSGLERIAGRPLGIEARAGHQTWAYFVRTDAPDPEAVAWWQENITTGLGPGNEDYATEMALAEARMWTLDAACRVMQWIDDAGIAECLVDLRMTKVGGVDPMEFDQPEVWWNMDQSYLAFHAGVMTYCVQVDGAHLG